MIVEWLSIIVAIILLSLPGFALLRLLDLKNYEKIILSPLVGIILISLTMFFLNVSIQIALSRTSLIITIIVLTTFFFMLKRRKKI